MRVAALYDIHGNLAALDAVLAELDDEVQIVAGGDFVGEEMAAVDRLRSLGDRVHFVRGNGERELGAEEFAGLPLTVTLEVDGLGRVLFCHATPRSDDEILTPLSPESRFRDALADTEADVIVAGHTHIQDDRMVDGVRFVNAGSVGMPYEAVPGAYWALLGPDVELRRTDYPGAPPLKATRGEAAEYFESLVE